MTRPLLALGLSSVTLVALVAGPARGYQSCSPVPCCDQGSVGCSTGLPLVSGTALFDTWPAAVSIFVDQYDGVTPLAAAEITFEFTNSGSVFYTNQTTQTCPLVSWEVDQTFFDVQSPTIPTLCASMPLSGIWNRQGQFTNVPPQATVEDVVGTDGFCDGCSITSARIGPLTDPSVLAQLSGNGQIEFEAGSSATFALIGACVPGSNSFEFEAVFTVSIQYYDCLEPFEYCFGVGCPCGNDDPDAGCANGTFLEGCRLTSIGTPSVNNDTLELRCTQSTPNQPGLLFQGNVAINNGQGVSFGDGLRCAGGNVIRLQTRTADGNGNAASTVQISGVGNVSAGDVKRYQWWYRDPSLSLCGHGFVLSNGLEVTWGP